jgi:hypothetical protein
MITIRARSLLCAYFQWVRVRVASRQAPKTYLHLANDCHRGMAWQPAFTFGSSSLDAIPLRLRVLDCFSLPDNLSIWHPDHALCCGREKIQCIPALLPMLVNGQEFIEDQVYTPGFCLVLLHNCICLGGHGRPTQALKCSATSACMKTALQRISLPKCHRESLREFEYARCVDSAPAMFQITDNLRNSHVHFTGRAVLPRVHAQVWHAGEDQHRGLHQV